MNHYRFNSYIKISFLLCAVTLAGLFFYINKYITSELKKELNQQVETIAESYQSALNNKPIDTEMMKNITSLADDLNLSIIIKTVTNVNGIQGETCEQLSLKNTSSDCNPQINALIKNMAETNKPFVSDDDSGVVIYTYYGDTSIINTIQWVPYIQLGFAVIAALIVLLGMNIMNSSENNMIYAGMAKETAHQLGTPISSLMGWLDLLKVRPKDKDDIVSSMYEDLEHLKNISNKFNKIGSEPKFQKITLNLIFKDLISYFNKRIPTSKNIDITLNCEDEFKIDGDSVLIYWAFENLIKNSIESIVQNKGEIEIIIINNNNELEILIIDNGKPISRSQRNKIFKPGFSTKNKGWGLGLSLTQRIIKDIHKGSISLISSTNEQTTFQIKFKSFYSS